MARPVAIYPYHDASGQLLYQKVRLPGKQFIWQHPTETGGWVDRQGGSPDVLYNLPAVVAAVAAGETITVCEGEKDADALNALGFCATTPPHPSESWGSAMAKVLAGAEVYVYWDNDEAGHARAWYAVDALMAVGALVTCWHAPSAKDVAEHLKGGGTPETMEQAMPPRPTAGFVPYANGAAKPPTGPLKLRKADCPGRERFRFVWDNRVLLGYFNLMVGEEGIGKGNLFAWMAANVTRGTLPGNLGEPRAVLFVGDEDSWDHIWTPRLAAVGADLDLCWVVDQELDLTKETPLLTEAIGNTGAALIVL